MQITNVQSTIQTEMIKKSQDVVKNLVGDILEKNFENTKKIEEMAAQATGKGINLNIKV